MSNTTKKILFILLISIALTQLVHGIGITPGSKTISFEPGLEQEITFKIVNNEQKAMRVELRVEGDLAQYITLPERLIDFTPTENEKTFSYNVKLPQELTKPGIHTTKILAVELPPNYQEGDTSIGAKVGVITKLFVQVPYPGTYAESTMKIKTGKVNETTEFLIKVFNFGLEDIQEAKATVNIYNANNELIETVESNSKSIKSKDTKDIKATWKGQAIGVYKAIATLDYDGKETTSEAEFYIGSIYIELLDVRVTNFNLGDIAKFEFDIENQWNALIRNVFAEVTMKSLEGVEIDSFKSTSSDLPALEKDTILAYWDTTNFNTGNYLASIVIGYADGLRTEKEFSARVTLDGIELNPIGPTGRVVSTSTPNKYLITGVLVGFVLISNIIWFIYYKRKKKKIN